ncbi:hypothetical protein Tco_0315206, partial [Tanacetum coccineum]
DIHRDLKDWILLLLLKIQDKVSLSNRHPCSKRKYLIIRSCRSRSMNILTAILSAQGYQQGQADMTYILMLDENIRHDD